MASNQTAASCCVTVDADLKKAGECPACRKVGKRVGKFTVSVMVKDAAIYLHPERLSQDGFYMCESHSCPVVYFEPGDGKLYGKEDLRVRVWQKEDDPEVPACYCFHHSVSTIRRELKENGSTDLLSRIGREVKAGNCRCEVTNPQGSCCLGNVAKAVKIANESVLSAGSTSRLPT